MHDAACASTGKLNASMSGRQTALVLKPSLVDATIIG
jgi:hypothetical protein